MRTQTRRFVVSCVLTFACLLSGCGGAAEPTASNAAAIDSRPKNAADIAQQLIGGKVGALVFVDRARGNPSASKFLQVGAIKEMLDGTSFDPLRDIQRAYVTGPSASEPRAVVFAEHTLTNDRIPVVVADMVRKSDPPGEVLSGAPEWRVHVSKRGRSGVVAFLPPHFVVMVPDDLAQGIDRFEKTGGLPGPSGGEAAKLYAIDPSTSLRARGVPPVPPSVSALQGDVSLRPDGGVTIDATGQSTPDQAPKDAADLTKSIDDATSFGIGMFRVRAFRPIVFSPAGDHIVAHHELSAGEVDTLLAVAAAFVQ